jgi:hypothetical protein
MFNMVECSTTYKTMTHAEEEVGVIRGELRESIEGVAVDGYRYRCQEHGTLIEGEPVGMMIV